MTDVTITFPGHEPIHTTSEKIAEAAKRTGRRKRRLSEAMDDNKALSAEALALGLISEEAHAETTRIADGLANKLGAGVIHSDGKETAMSKTSFAQGQLKSLVERIERLEEEKKSLSSDIKEVYAEAKANGFDTKILRKVIALRKKDRHEREEEEAILDLYLNALGMQPQGSFDLEGGE